MGAPSGAARPARRSPPAPHPGGSDGSAAPAPGEGGGRAPLTMLAGGRGGSGELALGLRARPVRTVQVMIPADSGGPRPAHREPLPHPGPAGPLYKERGPPARLTGDAPNDPSAPPAPRPKVTEEAGSRARRPARRAAARGPPPGPDPRREGSGPRQGLPGAAFRSRGGPGPGAERAEAERGPGGAARGPSSGERPGLPRCPRRLSPHGGHRRPAEHPSRGRPELSARARGRRSQQPSRAGSGERPAWPHGAGTGPIRNRAGGGGAGGGAAPDGSRWPRPRPRPAPGAMLVKGAARASGFSCAFSFASPPVHPAGGQGAASALAQPASIVAARTGAGTEAAAAPALRRPRGNQKKASE